MSTRKNISIQEANNIFFRLENNFGLFDRDVDDVYYWERVRHSVHKEITMSVQKKGVNDEENQKSKNSSNRIKNHCEYLHEGFKNCFYNNPYFNDDCKIIFYQGVRRRKLEGFWYDIYLDPIAEQLDYEYTFFEPKFGEFPAPSENRKFLSLPNLTADILNNLVFGEELPEKERDKLTEFENTISGKLGVDIDVVSKVKDNLSRRRFLLPLYKSIFQRMNPDLCLMTYAHSHHLPFLEACQTNNVSVVEVQNSSIHSNYVPYHYPYSGPKIKPDHIFLWGEYWKNVSDLPFSKNEIYITGFPHITSKINEYENNTEKNQLVFLSTPKSGIPLSKLAADFAPQDPTIEVIYKLHNGEFETWEQDYPELVKVAERGLIDVIDNDERSLHALLAESSHQVGINTTALYEGLAFGLNTHLLKSDRTFELQPLYEQGYANLISDSDDLISTVQNNKSTIPDSEPFFAKNPIKKTQKAVHDILSST